MSETEWTEQQAFDLARRLCTAHGGDPDAPINCGHGEVGESWQIYLPMAVEALFALWPKVTDEMVEAFGQAFWSVNARSKIDAHRDEIAAALRAALSHPASPE